MTIEEVGIMRCLRCGRNAGEDDIKGLIEDYCSDCRHEMELDRMLDPEEEDDDEDW